MKKIFKLIAPALLMAAALGGCIKDGSQFDMVTDVPEGVYITGPGTQFSVEAVNGKFTPVDGQEELSTLYTWLGADARLRVSIVGEDGQPQRYGGLSSATAGAVTTWQLGAQADAITVPHEGLYRVVVNSALKEANLVPVEFQIAGKVEMSEDGSNVIPFGQVSYDGINHVATWKTSALPEIMYTSEYRINYAGGVSFAVDLDGQADYTFPSSFSGPGRSPNVNVLTDQMQPISTANAVNLKLKKSGTYIMTLAYDVIAGAFSAMIAGTEMPEPEPDPEATGYTPTLWMTGDAYGNAWDGAVEMIPVSSDGVPGNGCFWTICNFAAGEGVKWAPGKSATGDFATLGGENANFTVTGGKAVPTTPGLWLVFVDMSKNKIAFDKPAVFGTGGCFNDDDLQMDVEGGKLTATTLTKGNLRMYAASAYNGRRGWESMEFNIYNGKLIPRGLSLLEQEAVPVNLDVPLELDFTARTGKIQVTPAAANAVKATKATPMYMIASTPYYGGMNWGSANVMQMHEPYQQYDRYWGVYYFPAGTTLRWSQSKCFGEKEFAQLENTNTGFTVVDGAAVIATAGTYSVLLDLTTRAIYIEAAIPVTYGSATDTSGDNPGSSMTSLGEGVFSYTTTKTGRLRFQSRANIFYASPAVLNPTCTGWRREYSIDMDSNKIYYREGSTSEPNAAVSIPIGTTVTLDFKTGTYTLQ